MQLKPLEKQISSIYKDNKEKIQKNLQNFKIELGEDEE